MSQVDGTTLNWIAGTMPEDLKIRFRRQYNEWISKQQHVHTHTSDKILLETDPLVDICMVAVQPRHLKPAVECSVDFIFSLTPNPQHPTHNIQPHHQSVYDTPALLQAFPIDTLIQKSTPSTDSELPEGSESREQLPSDLRCDLKLTYSTPQWCLCVGQTAAIYRGDVCLGGGIFIQTGVI